MSGGAWSPDQYEQFKDERSRPFFDLLALVKRREGMRVADLGCGTGELTRAMHRELGARETVGVDVSESMLARSAAFAGDGLRFERSSIEAWSPNAPVDLVFSNAALQWVDDHRTLLPRLASMLAPGGQIAVQIPSNDHHPSHVVAAEVARESPFREALGGYVRVFPNLAIADYALLLDALGFREQHVRKQVYLHRLASSDAVVEWVKGTLLTDYAKRMDDEMNARFIARYREALRERLRETGPAEARPVGARLAESRPQEAGPAEARPYPYSFERTVFWGAR
jgi:trans-aconitate 2-methyltransferase